MLALLFAIHFHINLTNMASIAKQDPTLHLTPQQLASGGQQPVYWLSDAKNAGWRWIVLNPQIEQSVNFNRNPNFDISFKGNDETSAILRCLHDECNVVVTTPDKKETRLTLHRDETKVIPLDSDLDLTLKDSTK